jgi:hypothetical protein
VEGFALPVDLARALCSRLGVDWPAGVRDLDALYRAWCGTVPFDNVSKHLALAEGRHPPGDDPVAAAELFLETGLGGTCWTHVGLLAGLLLTAGARATVGLDRNLRADGKVDFHSFVVVHEGGERWVLDRVWVSGRALPLRAGEVGDHPVMGAGVLAGEDPGDPRLRHWGRPSRGGIVTYRVLALDLDRDDVRAFCAVSGRFSGLPDGELRLGLTTPTASEGLALAAPEGVDDESRDRAVMWVRRITATETTCEPFADPDAAFAALGCTPAARRLTEKAGLLPL